MDRVTEMLRDLTMAPGVAGFESGVKQVLARYLEPYCTLESDNLGSLIGRVKGGRGGGARPRVMIAAHMDEIGFLVKLVTKEGFIRFSPVGGWWDQVLLGQRVVIQARKGEVYGVVGCKPPHILTDEERKKVLEKKDMFIDVGARDEADARTRFGIREGDPIVPVGCFHRLGEDVLMAKAWDDRIGCAALVEVARHLSSAGFPGSVTVVGTVQEEVGLRGARTSSFAVEPDVGIAVDVAVATDTPGSVRDQLGRAELGKGPVIVVLDRSVIPNPVLRDLFFDAAAEIGVECQAEALESGGTDSGAIHTQFKGVPSISIGIPARYIHSHAGLIHLKDFTDAVRLIAEVVTRLDSRQVARLVS